MKLELSYDEVSAIVAALLTKAMTAESNALKCAKYGMDKDVEFWQERAENYRKVYEAVEAQRLQMLEEYEQAAAALMETEGEG